MPDEKKLIVDEDWKSQVQAEKEQAAKRKAETSPEAAGQGPPDSSDMPMPAASLEMLLTTLATEALVAMGQIAHPATGQSYVHRGQAQYLIDTIDVLRQKTKGNLTPNEQLMFDNLLHQLRMAFIESANTAPSEKST